MAIKTREGVIPRGLIFRSDGGGQFYDDEFLNLTAELEIANSMCEFAWENGKAERLNGVIKNNYLVHRSINSYEELIKEVDRSVSLYNTQKPHSALRRLTPVNFEKQYLATDEVPKVERSTVKYTTHITTKKNHVMDEAKHH